MLKFTNYVGEYFQVNLINLYHINYFEIKLMTKLIIKSFSNTTIWMESKNALESKKQTLSELIGKVFYSAFLNETCRTLFLNETFFHYFFEWII